MSNVIGSLYCYQFGQCVTPWWPLVCFRCWRRIVLFYVITLVSLSFWQPKHNIYWLFQHSYLMCIQWDDRWSSTNAECCRMLFIWSLCPNWQFSDAFISEYLTAAMTNWAYAFNTLRPRQIDAISQTTFSNAFSWMKMFEFRLKFHWSLFSRVQ